MMESRRILETDQILTFKMKIFKGEGSVGIIYSSEVHLTHIVNWQDT